MASTRDRHTARRRAEIVDAALACFVGQGYANTTIADIRRRSKASTGSIYHHFGSKERIASAVYLEGTRAYQDGFLRILADASTARSGIRAMIGFHLNWVEANRDWTTFLLRMRHAAFMAEAEDEFKRLNRYFFESVAAWMDRQVAGRKIHRLPPDLFIAIVLGPCQEYVRLRFAGAPAADVKTAARTLADAAWRSVAAQ